MKCVLKTNTEVSSCRQSVKSSRFVLLLPSHVQVLYRRLLESLIACNSSLVCLSVTGLESVQLRGI